MNSHFIMMMVLQEPRNYHHSKRRVNAYTDIRNKLSLSYKKPSERDLQNITYTLTCAAFIKLQWHQFTLKYFISNEKASMETFSTCKMLCPASKFQLATPNERITMHLIFESFNDELKSLTPEGPISSALIQISHG